MTHADGLAPAPQTIEIALARWGLQGASYSLIAQRENQVFRVETQQQRFALRFHRPGYRSDGELASELAWTRMLSQAGLAVPKVLPSVAGQLLETLDGWQIDLLDWLDGEPMGRSTVFMDRDDKQVIYHRLGQAMARLHAASDAWQPPEGFQRWSWDQEGLLGEAPLWDRFWDSPALAADDLRLFARFRGLAKQDLENAKPRLDYGLIHADLVRENVMIAGQILSQGRGEDQDQVQDLAQDLDQAPTVALIDFDDGGYGYRLFEIATALLKITAEADFEQSKQALIAGYHSARALDMTDLPLFMALRAVTYVGWIWSRLGEPGAAERQQRFIAAAREQIGAYLAVRTPG